MGPGVLDHLAAEGARRSLRSVSRLTFFPPNGRLIETIPLLDHDARVNRYCLQLLTPASILASIQGRAQIELEDVGEMNDLFLDARTSAEAMARSAVP